ncbi:c-type cytochrome biogenesis protein CcsB [Gulosibacter bifidus]|uniref:C-type cytochrome biogenesis protein CcsB n=1 Tax=Gulosibacter bifidus TaxID=272239 RepID=A0ABW5RLN0_9MICO|nr:c-type cytochrome biogenesis protein CcsB [Gulosibacter bifidus]
MIETLSNWSNSLLFAAIVVYAVAFVCFTFDIALRGSKQQKASAATSAAGATARKRELVGAAVGADAAGMVSAAEGSADAVTRSAGISSSIHGTDRGVFATRAKGEGTASVAREEFRDKNATKLLPYAMIATAIGFVLHLAATVLLGIAAGRVPWSNMYEFSMTATLIVTGVFLAVQAWQDLRFLGSFVTGLVTLSLGIASLGFYVEVVPLQPALQSWWLVVHVFVASLSTGLLALGCGLSILQLLQQRRQLKVRGGAAAGGPLTALPGAVRLEDLAFRLNVIGFIFWTFTLVAGSIWAEAAWGRYWGWDTKEVWTLIIWIVYAGYLHARATHGWRGSPSAWLSIIGFGTVLFNFGIVNVFFKGLHAYSGL